MARPWYSWYPGDYARATAHLTFVEDAAYRRMLDHYYSTGSLPANAEILLRVCRAFADDEKAAVLKMASEFFQEVDGFLVQERVADEIDKSRYLSGIRSNAGKSGASKTNGKRSANKSANSSAKEPAIADTTTITTTSIKNTCAISSPDGLQEPAGFSECWESYPKREGGNSRKEALKAYRARLKGGATPEDLLSGVKRYAAYVRAKGQEGTAYVKQGASFFGTGEHWRETWEVALVPAGAPEVPNQFKGAI